MANKKEESFTENLIETTNDILETKDTTSKYKPKDIKKNKGMALLAYIFVPIPLFFEKKSEFVKYHVVQGFNLFVCFIMYVLVYSFLSKITKLEVKCVTNGLYYDCGKRVVPWFVELPFLIIGMVLIALTISGIVNVINGKAKQVPILGKFNVISLKSNFST